MTLFGGVYHGRRVLLTGHTGFKGSWLGLWLTELGASVTGLALDPSDSPGHWQLLDLGFADQRQDVRDPEGVRRIVAEARPEIVFHLAAQSLVRRSYREPLHTWSTNVMGTAHVLSACRQCEHVRAIVVVTTDKVYANDERVSGYSENDRLGGHDPYSASKAACEILVESYRKSFFGIEGAAAVASARAGNVIGGGDWAEGRLIPDVVRALRISEPVLIRLPEATRPWQHVLECLAGYLILGQRLLTSGCEYEGAWNFGPHGQDNRPVAEVLELLRRHWPELNWQRMREPQPHEAMLLHLDHGKATRMLGWQPVWSLEEAVRVTADWYRAFYEGAVQSRAQLAEYIADARAAGATWISS